MKIRTDFVSNSSSSSFIIADYKGSFVDRHKLTKNDFVDAVISLLGGKESYNAYVEHHKSYYYDGHKFHIYDKRIESDLKTISGKSMYYLNYWKCDRTKKDRKTGDLVRTDGSHIADFSEAYDHLREVYSLPYDYHVVDAHENKCSLFDHALGTFVHKPIPYHVDKVIHDLYDYYGIMSNKDVLDSAQARFLFRFGDNVIWELDGTQEPGKNESKWDNSDSIEAKRYNAAIDSSVWESDSTSVDRIAEVLFNWFRDHEKLKQTAKDESWRDLENDIIAATTHE